MVEVVAALIWDKAKFMISPDEIPNYDFCPADEENRKHLFLRVYKLGK